MHSLATITEFPAKNGAATENETHLNGSLSRERFYHTVLESLAEGVIITDASERIFYANGVASEITGYTMSELLGAKLRDILSAGDPDALEIPSESSTDCTETEIRRKDGQLGWVCIWRTPYRNE